MSLFRFVKYSSILYLLGKHRDRLFRSLAVLLFALVTSLLYDDLRVYLESQHPETLIYALIAKVIIVYGSFVFVLWEFRPRASATSAGEARAAGVARKTGKKPEPEVAADSRSEPDDRLSALADVDSHRKLRTRYERVLAGEHRPAVDASPRGKTGEP